ncbi:MAG: 4-(cytidine 5'-diphospho)-2-C-methyl-D-erythritol kinase, partial [Sneathiella sp.]
PDGGDELIVRESTELALSVSGPFSSDIGDISDNLVLKAAHKLRQHTGCTLGAEIELVKNLPVASGIGGGSADAATALNLLVRLWKCKLSEDVLLDIGLSLGADVPACLLEKPLFMSGIGEKIQEVEKFPDLNMLLINSNSKVSTPEVFRNLTISNETPIFEKSDFSIANRLISSLKVCRNDLEPAALNILPDISQVLSVLTAQAGCDLARMSGSGATCFGLFKSRAAADVAASTIAHEFPEWWVKAMSV